MRAHHVIAIAVCLLAAGAGSARLAAAPAKPSSSIAVSVVGLGCSTPLGGDSFEARAWSWGAENVTDTSGGSGGGAGKAVISGLSLTRLSDACSPLLLKSVVTGKHHSSVTLTQFDSSGTVTTTVVLNEATITSWSVGGASTAAEATEQVRISFSKFTLTDAASGNKFCWDLGNGASC